MYRATESKNWFSKYRNIENNDYISSHTSNCSKNKYLCTNDLVDYKVVSSKITGKISIINSNLKLDYKAINVIFFHYL